jgi:hypothetical protein
VSRALLILGLVSLALAAPASAKELTSAQVCGSGDECAPLNDRRTAESITDYGSASPPPPKAPYYRLDFVYNDGGVDRNAFSNLFVPSRNLVATGGPTADSIAWYPVSGAALELIRKAAADLEPYATPAAWPRSIDDPIFTPSPMTRAAAADDATNWTPWLVAIAALFLALAAGGLLARRLRVRGPRTASP